VEVEADKQTQDADSEHSTVTLHEIIWKEMRDKCGNATKVRVVKLPEKIESVTALKDVLRSITGMSLFYKENVEFRPQLMLEHLKALKDAVWGEDLVLIESEKEKEETTEDSTKQDLDKDKENDLQNMQEYRETDYGQDRIENKMLDKDQSKKACNTSELKKYKTAGEHAMVAGL